MKVRLLVQMEGAAYPWDFSGNGFRTGRSMDCELPLSGPDCHVVSGHHARFEFSAHGLTVWDLGSKNGTFVNGRRIRAPHPVRIGDEINLGKKGPKLKIIEMDHPSVRQTAATVAQGAAFAPGAPHQPFVSPPVTPSVLPPPVAAGAAYETPHGQYVATPNVNTPLSHSAPANQSGGPTPTRMLLIGVMARQRRLWLIIAGLVCLLLIAVGAGAYVVFWRAGNDANPALTKDAIYKKALLSACWIRHAVVDKDGFEIERNGSGCLFNRKRRLIITNFHVVRGLKTVEVYFPAYEGGKAIRNRKHYIFNKLAKKGTVLARHEQLDLAVVQVDEIPEKSDAVVFAEDTPIIGTQIHLVGGNPEGAGNEVWGYGNGDVRGVLRDTRNIIDPVTGQVVQRVTAKFIRSDIPSNPGDSGAGVVNDRGLLVGVNNASAAGAGNSLHIDITDVERFLRNHDFYD